MSGVRICALCERELPADTDHFYPEPRVRAGLTARCRDCVGLASKHWKQRNPERAAESNRAHYERRRPEHIERAAEWKLAHPAEARAQRILQQAVRAGHIERKPCERCGEPESHGHHPNYDRALEVVWLCASCHKRHHLEAQAKDGAA